ncbi:DUF3396 domain-containing protein [Pseudomonas germanica]|uniref:DUF3396 domain-containing protein n=1 Tax=Pseudomonas germanica TaxID=2815720 RepID=UPI002A4E1670|nr:DUF3396 domain-containing protein [Pseudomonas germanica]
MNIILKNLIDQAPDLTIEQPDGTQAIKLGLIATIYFKNGYSLEKKKKIDECFARFHEEFEPLLKTMVYRRRKKLTNDSFKKARESILQTDPDDQFSWFLGSSSSQNEADSYSISMLNSFEAHGDKKRSFIKIVLPWTLLNEEDGVERFQEWITYLCEQVGAEHGYGGLSNILPYDYHSYMPTEYELARRYPGLQVDSMPHSSARELLGYIKGVNWFTILENNLIEQLGGESKLRQSLCGRGDVEIFSYKDGLIFRAGQYPELGDSEEYFPAAYIAVNNILKPLRIPAPDQLHSYSPYGNCFEKESTDKWYARFDRDENITSPPE